MEGCVVGAPSRVMINMIVYCTRTQEKSAERAERAERKSQGIHRRNSHKALKEQRNVRKHIARGNLQTTKHRRDKLKPQMILEPVTLLSTKIPHQSRHNWLQHDAQDRQESIGLIRPSPVMTSSSPLARNNLHVPVPNVCCMCRDTHVAPKQQDKNKVDVCSDRNELLNMLNILYDAT
jgi:hypothetical protein